MHIHAGIAVRQVSWLASMYPAVKVGSNTVAIVSICIATGKITNFLRGSSINSSKMGSCFNLCILGWCLDSWIVDVAK